MAGHGRVSMGDAEYMKLALKLAEKARKKGEVPIGAVIVYDDKVIARGYNRREGRKNALAHAEIIAIGQACKKLGNWRLSGCDMYVTLEPCQMCMGATRNARLRKVIFGAAAENSGLNHEVEVSGGVLEEDCKDILKRFFEQRRGGKAPKNGGCK